MITECEYCGRQYDKFRYACEGCGATLKYPVYKGYNGHTEFSHMSPGVPKYGITTGSTSTMNISVASTSNISVPEQYNGKEMV